MFAKILIANRGEIAVRIIRACKEMGIMSVAIYSMADADALHVALADESVCIGPAAASESYLDENRVMSAALATGVTAIHPGYGFLSENAHFASLCQKHGIAFIGPSAETMMALSDKAVIKARMEAAGLPVIKGSPVLEDVAMALDEAARIGYPVMLKARSGGGGRGIRKVENAAQLQQLFPLAVAESKASFNDEALYLEKCVYPARHVEMQILADEKGNVLCLGERDCSIQRRHQKLIEETPSPAVHHDQRQGLTQKVRQAVAKIGYVGAGTLEFLMDAQGQFWFMEMNLRLQVEHGITEMMTGVDIVKWQIRVAAGIPLSIPQEAIVLDGVCVECRINALTTGTVQLVHIPGGPFVRFDTALVQGLTISPFYDSLVGKLMVYAASREEAMRKLKAALCELVIEGIETNVEEQLAIVGESAFINGNYDLRFMEGRASWHC